MEHLVIVITYTATVLSKMEILKNLNSIDQDMKLFNTLYDQSTPDFLTVLIVSSSTKKEKGITHL